MRWNDWLILTTIGALLGGAYFRFRPPQRITLSQPGADGTYHDTYYVVAHVHYLGLLTLLVVLIGAAYVLVLRRSTRRVAVWGAVAICVFGLGTAFMIAPQVFTPRSGMPRRYGDYADAVEWWNAISATGAALATAALFILLVLTVRALIQPRRSR
ncbi:cbb3-type cytochrome c oxidase subunit I [Hasllibacter sp. MH4015]|uniref:cbb3-type cytochrome c oxidase subunit I n=1 Tax=Hasllibacter sp. MH4015 TaxID=2854029 RepID=UPI001CD240B6|nr:cbb3-type cytochrome c oxidase subunit I [Hasllibacter sp. MH4015]